jgi:hypothetical protein
MLFFVREYSKIRRKRIMKKQKTIAELIRIFDDAHLIKQIILIGEDGVTRNIELELIGEKE